MENKIILIVIISLLFLTIAPQVSAVTLSKVSTPILSPGESGRVEIKLVNNLRDDLEIISFKLKFENLPFNPIGSSERTIDEIESEDDQSISFTIKASNDVEPGNYEIPYTIEYEDSKTNLMIIKSGTIGIIVKANPQLTYSIETENPIENSQGRIILKIVNKGFFNARFVSVKLNPSGFTLLSNSEVYIGSVDSDDYETATFDVIFNKRNPLFTASIEYIDFDNERKTENINLPVTSYTKERAIELGLIKKSNTILYLGLFILVFLMWVFYKMFKKRKKLKKSIQNGR